MSIGSTIRARREAMGLTQEQAAERAGINRLHVTRWESGQLDGLGRLLDVLGLEVVAQTSEPGSIDDGVRHAVARGLGCLVAVDESGAAMAEVIRDRTIGYRSPDARIEDIGAELVRLVGVAGR